ncbi:transporter substrate-binding domain-containing diguanylate cyclase [Hydrogenovibrio kuenenii]|uniref:transporter substrate-binding domain-containing diguanylate cyclase n=1 Tax=Hydrogenovibrio kuenenii TaxID=63658 RepID=UPI0004664FA8|nr:diguanylate cyclase [Hydrogenovibrio kuenenii]
MKRAWQNTLRLLVFSLLVGFHVAHAANAVVSKSNPTPKPLEKVVLQLKWLHQFQFAGYYAAQKEGYFRDEGLQVEIRQRDVRKNNIQQVIDGDAQYGVADSVLFLYLAKKAPVVIVAPIFQHSPQAIFTLKSSGLDSPYKLQGKKLAFYKNDSDGFPILAMMEQLGVKPVYDRRINKTDPNILVRKEVDAYSGYLTNEAFYLRNTGQAINVINPVNYGIDLYGDMLFTSQKEALDHPSRVARFKRAVIKGWHYAMKHKRKMAQYILDTYHPVHKSLAGLLYEAHALEHIISESTVPIGTLDEGRVRFINALLKQHGLIAKDIDLEHGIYHEDNLDLQFTQHETDWMKKHPVIRLAIDNNWSPIEYVDSKGNMQGISASFFNYLTAKTGLVFKPDTHSDWVQAVEKMKKHQLDVYSAAISTEERRKYARFTSPYVKFATVIATRNDEPYLSQMKLLQGKVVAVTKDYAFEEMMHQLFPKVKLYLVKDAAEGLHAVSLGQAYGYVDNVAVIGHYIKTQGLTNLKISGELPYSSSIAIGVRKDWPELQSILQKVLNTMPTETYESLIKPWLRVSYQTQYQWKQLLVYVVPILIVFAIIMFFNHRLRKTQAELEESNEKLSRSSMTDHLTNIYNRQYLDQSLEVEKVRADRYESKLSLIMMDLDFFKKVNDTHGHLVGDKVLVSMSNLVSEHLRKTDVFGRWGGEEFMVICPETSIEQGVLLAEKIRKTVESATLPEGLKQTLSLGVAEYQPAEKMNDAIDRADGCLYEAKRNGRNQVRYGECAKRFSEKDFPSEEHSPNNKPL